MDLGASLLLSLLFSGSLNVFLLCCIIFQGCGDRAERKHQTEDVPDSIKQTDAELRQRAKVAKPDVGLSDEIAILLKSGKVYHKPSCMHVQKKSAEAKSFGPCKHCFKN